MTATVIVSNIVKNKQKVSLILFCVLHKSIADTVGSNTNTAILTTLKLILGRAQLENWKWTNQYLLI